ncbi:MAG: DUF222 domain-containing protein [Actinomycetales bacterium]|nr:DUF222 domain-containing protein [Actinomycetales bacterium]
MYDAADRAHRDVPAVTAVTAEAVRTMIDRLSDGTPATPDEAASAAALVDLVAALEELKAAAAAAQARATVALFTAQRADDIRRGADSAETARSVGAQVALARKDSPARGSRHLGLAQGLVSEMPQTLALLAGGDVSEWVATLVAQQTACLSPELRRQVDTQLATHLPSLSPRQARALAGRLTAAVDAAAVVRRNEEAVSSRRVSLRPAVDGMCILTAILPLVDGVAAFAALTRDAEAQRASGRGEGVGPIMADLLVQRLTGRDPREGFDVEIRLVMSAESMLGGPGGDGAYVQGYGPIDDDWARSIAAHGRATGAPPGEVSTAKAFVRRLFTWPGEAGLVRLESSRREFRGLLRESVAVRDRTCRMPFCDAPIRHVDHIKRAADGGRTTLDNGQGLCERCNYVKEAHGWRQRRVPDAAGHVVETTTPTGHTYAGSAPLPPGPLHRQLPSLSPLEVQWARLLDAA